MKWTTSLPPGPPTPDPPGYSRESAATHSSQVSTIPTDSSSIATKKAWDVALTPLKTSGMTLVMLYMSGTSAGIFTILIISYSLFGAVSALLNVRTAFSPLVQKTRPEDESRGRVQEGDSAFAFLPQKLTYGLVSLVVIGYIIYHCVQIGFFPLQSGDYASLIPEKGVTENVAFVMAA
eukprot:Polyplicarium_translucidae@DN280_c0_g1_i1.p1